MKLAYLYARFSSAKQETGDSIRRQTAIAGKWCKANGYRLDDSTTFLDEGVSALRGKNRETGALSVFLTAVRSGNVPKGSVLLIENIDRLSREEPWAFIGLLHELVKAGIRIVQLDSGEVLDDKTDMFGLFRVLLSQSRGHDEVSRRSGLIRANWTNWKATGVSKGGTIRPGPVPFWITRTDDGYTKNDKAEAVRLMFKWAGDGWGSLRIHRELRRKGIRVIEKKGSDGFATQVYITAVLKNPAVYGRCEELDRDDYFPAVITRDEFYRVQGVVSGRSRKGKTRDRDRVNLLSGMLENWGTGSTYITRRWKGTKSFVYFPYDKRSTGETDGTSFPVAALETGVLDCLRELDPAKVFGEAGADKLGELVGEADTLKARLAEAERKYEKEGLSEIAERAVKKWEARLAELSREIAQERARLANPVSDSLATAKRLMGMNLDDDETRLKVRAALGQVIKRIRVAFTSQGVWRLAYCIVELSQSAHYRELLVLYHRPLAGVVPEFFYSEGEQRLSESVEPAGTEAGFNYLRDIITRVEDERSSERRERRKEYFRQRRQLAV